MGKVQNASDAANHMHAKRGYARHVGTILDGPRHVIPYDDDRFPPALRSIPEPPACLYVIGDPAALTEGLAVIGARKATPYGMASARRFASLAASQGISIISGGALGCDGAAHRAALEQGGGTVVFLGGGCDCPYPSSHFSLFQQIIAHGGIVASEHEWGFPPKPYTFRARNRLIAGLAKATLIVEAGLPSGTFSTADEALAAGKEVLVVPGAITSKASAGSNRLLYQGAIPIVDDESFSDVLFTMFDCLKWDGDHPPVSSAFAAKTAQYRDDPLVQAILAQPMRKDKLVGLSQAPSGCDAGTWLAIRLAELEAEGVVTRYPDGRYGPAGV